MSNTDPSMTVLEVSFLIPEENVPPAEWKIQRVEEMSLDKYMSMSSAQLGHTRASVRLRKSNAN